MFLFVVVIFGMLEIVLTTAPCSEVDNMRDLYPAISSLISLAELETRRALD